MSLAAPTCLRCQGRMEPGFALDEGHSARVKVVRWIEGAPEKSFWSGIRTRGRRQLAITTWRCTRCGWLESYAAG